MFSLWRGGAATLFTFSALWLAGCGGGSSGPSPSPTPTRTPVVGATPKPGTTPTSNNVIIVRLRDANGLPVDGVVSLVVGADVFRFPTTGGQTSFVGLVPGSYAVSAEVNGRTQGKTFAAPNGTTTIDLVFANGITPTPAGPIPPPPFGN